LITRAARADARGEGIPPETAWILWCELFVYYELNGQIQGPHGSVFFALDAGGRILQPPSMQSFAREDQTPLLKSLMDFFWPMLLAISFQNEVQAK